MKVYEALASAILAEECGPIFSLMGDANLTMLSAFALQSDLPIIAARNETAAVAMADGYFRATGKPGVATITCGPGLTQTGTSLVAANRNASSIVVVTGDTPAHFPIKLQQLNQRRFVEACEARYHEVIGVSSLAEDIAEAFYAARVYKCPVVLSIDLDMLDEEISGQWSYLPSHTRYAPSGRLIASNAAIDLLAQELAAARKPLIIAGRGALLSDAREEIIALAERTGSLLGTTLLARGLFSGEPYDVGIVGGFSATPTIELLADADYVLAVGAELGHFTTYGGSLFPKARISRIDIAPLPWAAGIPPGLYVQGDARESVAKINDTLSSHAVSEGYRGEAALAALARTYELPVRPNDGVDPRRLMLNLSTALRGDDSILVGVGHFWSFPSMYLDTPDGCEIRFCHQFGSVGQTLPVAIGQAVAEPDRRHLVIEGDASLMMNMQEFDTASRHGVPLTLLIFNDGGLGAEVHKLKVKGHSSHLAVFPTPDFVGIARSVGADGVIVTHENEIAAAIQAGRDFKGFYVIDVRISPATISDPYLRQHFGQKVSTSLFQGRYMKEIRE